MESSGAATREERDAPAGHDRRILGIVVELLETRGYEAVQLREVARRARTSLATIYKHYANRDELILAALQMWLDENRYAGLAGQSRADGESFYDGQMRVLRTIFEPWEQHPAMLKAYFRARAAPNGERLVQRGLDAVIPAFGEVLADVDNAFVADLTTIVTNVVYGLLGRFAAGEIAITDIVPSLERTVYWLSHGYEATQR